MLLNGKIVICFEKTKSFTGIVLRKRPLQPSPAGFQQEESGFAVEAAGVADEGAAVAGEGTSRTGEGTAVASEGAVRTVEGPAVVSEGAVRTGEGTAVAREGAVRIVESPAVAREGLARTGVGSAGAEDTVAGDYEGDGIVADGSADCLGRHRREPALLGDPGCNLAVGHSLPVGDSQHNLADPLPEGAAAQIQRRGEVRRNPAEIQVQPPAGIPEHRKQALLMLRQERVRKVLLPVKPQPGQRLSVARHRNAPERRIVMPGIIHIKIITYAKVFSLALVGNLDNFQN